MSTQAAEICKAGFQREWSCTEKELQKYAKESPTRAQEDTP